MVVVVHPLIGLLAHLVQGTEHVGAEQFATHAAIEAFYVGVLCGLSRLDVGQGDAVCAAPVVV